MKPRTQLALGAAALLLCGTTLETHLNAQGAVPLGNPYATVKVLYLIPQDRPYRADYGAAIENAVLSVRSFYAGELGGVTFSLFKEQSPRFHTCRLPQNAAYYSTDSSEKLLADVQSCWAVGSSPTPPRTWLVFADLEHGCNATGQLEIAMPGLAIFGTRTLRGLTGEPVFEECGAPVVQSANWFIGGLAHQIGHTFGLPGYHNCNRANPTFHCYALMGDGYELYPNTYLRDHEKAALHGLPAFNCCPRVRPPDPTDFDGEGRTDIGVFRPSTGDWYVRYAGTGTGLTFVWGGAGDVPAVGDYDGDGLADIAIFRPSNGTWYVRHTATGTLLSVVWGGSGDVPRPGDYDGDGKTDIAIFRPSNGTWYVRYTASGALVSFVWGGPGDKPTPGDYDGDGKTDVAIFRPSTGTWYVRHTATGAGTTTVWGGAGDVPVQADYDGDGKMDIAIFRASNGTWYVRNSVGAMVSVVWGGGTDVPGPGDYNGDGVTDIAIFRPSTGTWYVRYSGTGAGTSFVWGGTGDIPVHGRF